MTVAQLIKRLETLPQDATATYFHNTYGVIHIEEIEDRPCKTLSGKAFDIIVLRGSKEDQKDDVL